MPPRPALQSLLSQHDAEVLETVATAEAHRRVMCLLPAHFAAFTPAQQHKIRALLGVNHTPAPDPQAADAPPRYWLYFSGQTWSGHGPVPPAFLAWEGTVAHTEWKRRHPEERFPRYPGLRNAITAETFDGQSHYTTTGKSR
jgi:DNA-binding protein H-NS